MRLPSWPQASSATEWGLNQRIPGVQTPLSKDLLIIVERDKLEREAIHAIALARWGWAVREDMAKMAIATRAL